MNEIRAEFNMWLKNKRQVYYAKFHDIDTCLLVCVVGTLVTSNRSRFRESKVVYGSK